MKSIDTTVMSGLRGVEEKKKQRAREKMNKLMVFNVIMCRLRRSEEDEGKEEGEIK